MFKKVQFRKLQQCFQVGNIRTINEHEKAMSIFDFNSHCSCLRLLADDFKVRW